MKYAVVAVITAVVVFIGSLIFFRGLPKFPSYNKTPISTQSADLVSVETPSPVPTPVDETADIATAIKSALIAKRGPDAASLRITVSKVEGIYAEGGASAEGGGAMWFAAKVNGIWTLIWDGNGTISCTDFAAYPDFPKTMLSECWDEVKMKNVVR